MSDADSDAEASDLFDADRECSHRAGGHEEVSSEEKAVMKANLDRFTGAQRLHRKLTDS